MADVPPPEESQFVEFAFGVFPRDYLQAVIAELNSVPPSAETIAVYKAMGEFLKDEQDG